VKRSILIWGPPVAVMLAIFLSASVPELDTQDQGVDDKTAHFVAYGVLGAAFVRAFAGGRWTRVAARTGWQAWLASAAYGATDEWHQSFVAGRTPSTLDWIADAAGAAVVVSLTVLIARWWRRREANREV
jgi:VanZ family protein